jgi:hypothetical protein
MQNWSNPSEISDTKMDFKALPKIEVRSPIGGIPETPRLTACADAYVKMMEAEEYWSIVARSSFRQYQPRMPTWDLAAEETRWRDWPGGSFDWDACGQVWLRLEDVSAFHLSAEIALPRLVLRSQIIRQKSNDLAIHRNNLSSHREPGLIKARRVCHHQTLAQCPQGTLNLKRAPPWNPDRFQGRFIISCLQPVFVNTYIYYLPNRQA